MWKQAHYRQRNYSQPGIISFKLEYIPDNNGEDYMISLINWGKHVFVIV
jgi:hypothetical protein